MSNIKIGDKVKVNVSAGSFRELYPPKDYIGYVTKHHISEQFYISGYPQGLYHLDRFKDSPSWFSLIKDVKSLTMNDIKEGMTLIALDNYKYYDKQFIKNNEYLIIKHPSFNCITLLGYECVWLSACNNINEKLKHFKIKEEISMLDPEIYAVGTIHKSVNGKNTYFIIKRDIVLHTYTNPIMIVQNKETQYLSTRDQHTGKTPNSNDRTTDLAITKKKIKGWINVKSQRDPNYKWNATFMYPTKEAAMQDMPKTDKYIACIEVEFEEGEGL